MYVQAMFSFSSSMRLNISLKVTLYLEAAAQKNSVRNVFLKASVPKCFLNKVTGWRVATL